MRILFFSPYFSPYISGITTYTFKLLRHLSKKHQITVLTFNHTTKLPHTQIKDGMTIHRLPYLFKISKGFISPRSLKYFYKHLYKSDIVISNLPNVEGLPLVIMSKLLGKQVICIYNCQVFLGKKLPALIISSVLDFAITWQLKLSHHIVAHTKDYAKDKLRHQILLEKVKYIPPYIDKPHFDGRQYEDYKKIKQDAYWIGFVGRISSEKGLQYLIEAIKLIPQYQKFELIIAGPQKEVAGEEKYYQFIQKKLQSSGINYRLLGALKQKHLGAFYRSLDVLVLPSVNETEAFGIVQVEAMHSGTPVIASDIPGVRVPVQRSHLGKLSPPGDIHSLAQNIQYVVNNKQKIINSSNDINSFFSTQNIIQDWDTLLSQTQTP